jgi:hypothetical protein
MSNGRQKLVSSLHDPLAAAMRRFRGHVLETFRVQDEFVAANPHLAHRRKWAQPSDHCKDHSCDHDCDCALTNRAIFVKVSRGHYRVR